MDWKGFWKRDWYLIGLLPLAFGTLAYILAIVQYYPDLIADPVTFLWGFLSACTVTAVLLGITLLSRSRFAISAVIPWTNAPISYVLTQTMESFQLGQFHHILSVAVLVIILYHWREIWNTKGFLFGIASFLAFVTLTFYASGEIANTFSAPPPLWVGIVSAIAAVAIFLWYWLRRKK